MIKNTPAFTNLLGLREKGKKKKEKRKKKKALLSLSN
jgi:hypothetical protein